MKFYINQKLIFEFLSISFAVFLGLLLNQWNDNRNHQQLAEQSIYNISTEINKNKAIVENMLSNHRLIQTKVDSMLSKTDAIILENEADFDLTFNIVRSTSWETAKLTQAIAYMDIDLVTAIAGLYAYQSYYESIVKNYVLNSILNRPKDGDKELLKNVQHVLNAIIPIETNMIEYFQIVEKKLKE